MSNNNSYIRVKYIWDQFGTLSLAETKVASFLQDFHKRFQLIIILFCTTETYTSHISFIRSNSNIDFSISLHL